MTGPHSQVNDSEVNRKRGCMSTGTDGKTEPKERARSGRLPMPRETW